MNLTISEAINGFISHPILLLILTVGAFGWWRLIALDTVFDRPRNWFWQKFPFEGYTSDERPSSGRNVFSGGTWYCQKGRWISELIRCPWCLGWWIAVTQFVCYLLNPTLVLAFAFLHLCRVVAALCHHKVG